MGEVGDNGCVGVGAGVCWVGTAVVAAGVGGRPGVISAGTKMVGAGVGCPLAPEVGAAVGWAGSCVGACVAVAFTVGVGALVGVAGAMVGTAGALVEAGATFGCDWGTDCAGGLVGRGGSVGIATTGVWVALLLGAAVASDIGLGLAAAACAPLPIETIPRNPKQYSHDAKRKSVTVEPTTTFFTSVSSSNHSHKARNLSTKQSSINKYRANEFAGYGCETRLRRLNISSGPRRRTLQM